MKPLESFVKDKRSRDGRTARCKPCTNAAQRERYVRNDYRAHQREYERANRDRVRAANKSRIRAWRQRNPAKAREHQRRSARLLQERHPNYFREWYWRNIERERKRAVQSMRKHRTLHPERDRERRQRYRQNNPDTVRARERENTHRRRALKQGTSNALAAFMTELVKEPCAYCGETENITIDHVVPLSRGGTHEADNLAPACSPCNASKCNRLLSEWPGRLGRAAR